jgi:membrane dipeptidase
MVVQKAEDIDQSVATGKLGLIMGWQTASILGDRSGQEIFNGIYNPEELTGLRAWYQLGLRIINLTYNTTNAFAGGCLEPEIGLTLAGRRLVEEIHSLGILLDVGGHTGKQSSLDALAMSKGVPVICSHTNVAALCQNPRNTSDEVFEKIAATGGVIGISAINDFVARCGKDKNTPSVPQVDLPALLDHFDYLRKLVGVDHIGLGPDFTHGSEGGVDPDNVLFGREMASEQSPIVYVKGFEKITEIGNLEAGLAARGWTSAEIDQVFGLNWLRVYRQVW